MNTRLVLLFFWCLPTWCLPTFCWADAVTSADAVNPATERQRIQAQRSQVQARHALDEAACQRNFSVNDCLALAGAKRNELLGDLRRQELSINATEARQKASDQVSRREENLSAEAQREQAQRRADAKAQSQSRQQELEDKAAQRADKATQVQANLDEANERLRARQEAQADRQAKAGAAAAEKKKYDDKQAESEARQAQILKRKQDSENPKK